MLNNLFSFAESSNSSSKLFLKNTNKIIYNFLLLTYSIFKNTINLFQRFFTTLFGAKLQLNRLPFRSIPESIKKFLVVVVVADSWTLFFKRIKNNNNLYIIREKKNTFVYRFWCIFYKTKIINFSELNAKCKFTQKTTNLYNILNIDDTCKTNMNTILFYYLNKLVLTNYPYFYWTYIHLYSKYESLSNSTNQSRSNKEIVVFLVVHNIKQFFNQTKKVTFVKTSLNSFKGVRTTLKNIENLSNFKVVTSLKILQNDEKQPLSSGINLFERDFLKSYNNFFKISSAELKFYANSVIYNNAVLFTKRVNNQLNNSMQYLQIQWYNKVHNSILDVTKNNIVLYLRAARHFNKGRYSRNRQLYRTGVYWCIWLNVVIVYALHYYFYRVVFSFGYLWVPLALMILVMFSSRLHKYRYYSVKQLILEFKEFNNFVYYNTVNFNNTFYLRATNIRIFFLNFFKNYIYLFTNVLSNVMK